MTVSEASESEIAIRNTRLTPLLSLPTPSYRHGRNMRITTLNVRYTVGEAPKFNTVRA